MLVNRITQPTFTLQLSAGVSLIAVSWLLTWLPTLLDDPTRLRNHLLFFPLWLGYILVVDAWVWKCKATSLLRRDGWAFIGLFLVSAPAWWIFEVINWRTGNWEYLGREHFSDLEYLVLASVAFSTVMPAVFETAELVSSFAWFKRLPSPPPIPMTLPIVLGVFGFGVLTFALMLLFPRYFFPFMWLSLFFILEPVNLWRGDRSLAGDATRGNWRPVFALGIGALICGFFWEMWNFYGYPKWDYHVPFVEFLHIFEMPLLGYGGYLPFGLELFAMYHLISGLWNPTWQEYVEVG